jgi:hypothetical protein
LRGRFCPDVSEHVLTCTCLNCTWREALDCLVWIGFHIYLSGLGLIYLIILRWSRCTPGLRTGNVYLFLIIWCYKATVLTILLLCRNMVYVRMWKKLHRYHAYAVSAEIDHADQIPPLMLKSGGNVKCLPSEFFLVTTGSDSKGRYVG